MKKSFITLAVLVALVPHLGFPQMWKDVFVSIAAILIIVLVIIPRRESAPRGGSAKREASFIEGAPQPEATKQDQVLHEETPL